METQEPQGEIFLEPASPRRATVTGRLAPTPSGTLHLGNALAFGAAWLSARAAGGRVLLRVEDLDRGRAREAVAQSQRDDLRWLGIDWDEETPPQSMRAYDLAEIDAYPCACARAARLAGRCACRDASTLVVADPERYAWRLRSPRHAVAWVDRARGPQLHVPDDDPVLVRAGGEAGYPLAVVMDDARDGVTEVVRGADLVEATAAQVVLHEMLGLPRPTYLHVPLLLGLDGRKLGKSHGSTDVRALRAAGWMPEDVWRRLLPLLGLEGPTTLAEAVGAFDAARVQRGPFRVGDDGSVAG